MHNILKIVIILWKFSHFMLKNIKMLRKELSLKKKYRFFKSISFALSIMNYRVDIVEDDIVSVGLEWDLKGRNKLEEVMAG